VQGSLETYGCGFWQKNANQQDGSARLQPGRQIGRALEVEQGFCQGLQLLQRQGLDPVDSALDQGTAAAVEWRRVTTANGLAFLAALLSAFDTALTKDLMAGHALRELIDVDAAHGTELADGTAVEPAEQRNGDHIGIAGRDPLLDRDAGEQEGASVLLTSHRGIGGCPIFAGIAGFFSKLSTVSCWVNPLQVPSQ
jgi:hypothetical protein